MSTFSQSNDRAHLKIIIYILSLEKSEVCQFANEPWHYCVKMLTL